MSLAEILERELAQHEVAWCRGCDRKSSHKRGFATKDTIHYDAAIRTRATLYDALHELGHIVLGHLGAGRKRRWEREQEAERWAQKRMRELGFAVPRRQVAAGRGYVARMRRWGRNISRAHRHRFTRYGEQEPMAGQERER